jgi:hypothetical protein
LIEAPTCLCGFYPTGLTPPLWHTCRYRNTREFSSPLDPGIERAVHILLDNGVETYESCQGGEGHSSPYPVVRFYGQRAEGIRALSVALMYELPVFALHRVWRVEDGEPTGPQWELEFRPGPAGSPESAVS